MTGFGAGQSREYPGTGSRDLLGVRVDATDYERAVNLVLEMARTETPGYVCAANVHMLMEAQDSPAFREVVNGAALVTPDGMPLVWLMRRLGIPGQKRVYGPTLMLELCKAAADSNVPVGLFGGRRRVLDRLTRKLEGRFPGLDIVYKNSPPFRKLTGQENASYAKEIGRSGAKILFVALGCPAQELWMAMNRDSVPAVMLGVGAAFEFHAGVLRQAPGLVQDVGLEWLFRLVVEPKRLWRRYLRHNPRFVVRAAAQLLEARWGNG